jgi:hypothetical protein
MATFGTPETRIFGTLFGPVGTHTFADYGIALAVTPLTTGSVLTIITPDQVATGIKVRIWAEYTNNTTTTPLVTPQIRIFYLDALGVRKPEIALASMTVLGEGAYYDWTPTKNGTFLTTVAAVVSSTNYLVTSSVTARARYDNTARALNDTLVSRF